MVAVKQEEVWIRSKKRKLFGVLFTPKKGKNLPGVLAGHGLWSTCEELGDLPVDLAKKGIVVLAIDFSGHGRSGGMEGMINENWQLEDIQDGIKWLRKHDQVDSAKISYIGHSLGGYMGILYAGKRRDLHRLVASCPPTSLSENISSGKKVVNSLLYGMGKAIQVVTRKPFYKTSTLKMDDLVCDKECQKTAKIVTLDWRMPVDAYKSVMKLDVRPHLKRVKTPTLVIYAKHDRLADPEQAKLIHSRLECKKKLLPLDSGHSIMNDRDWGRALDGIYSWIK